MKKYSKLLRVIHEFRIANDMTYKQTADELEKIEEHYRWFDKIRLEQEVKKSFKESITLESEIQEG